MLRLYIKHDGKGLLHRLRWRPSPRSLPHCSPVMNMSRHLVTNPWEWMRFRRTCCNNRRSRCGILSPKCQPIQMQHGRFSQLRQQRLDRMLRSVLSIPSKSLFHIYPDISHLWRQKYREPPPTALYPKLVKKLSKYTFEFRGSGIDQHNENTIPIEPLDLASFLHQ